MDTNTTNISQFLILYFLDTTAKYLSHFYYLKS